MPFDATTGRVYAPVSVEDVRLALGLSLSEAGAGDVGYLCSHDKICPYSLIQPQYFYDKTGDSPDTGPEAFANDRPDINYLVPEAKKAEVNGSYQLAALPCAKEINFQGNGTYSYKGCRWGYYVPYIPYRDQINDLFALRDLYWKRYGPKDDAKDTNGLLTTTWYCLSHFDGYLKDVEPDPVLSGVILEYGNYPQCTPKVPAAGETYRVADILNLNSKGEALHNNPGGKVSVAAVFSETNMIYGASLFRKEGTGYVHEASKVGRAPGDGINGDILGGSGTLPILSALLFSDKPVTDRKERIFIPWVTDAAVTNGDNGTLNVPAGARFYGLNFDENFKAWVDKKAEAMQPKVFSVSNVSHTDGTLPNTKILKFTLTNERADYPLVANMVKGVLTVKTGASTAGRTISFAVDAVSPATEEEKKNLKMLEIGVKSTKPISGTKWRTYQLSFSLNSSETLQDYSFDFYCEDNNNPVKVSTPQNLNGALVDKIPDLTDPFL